MAEFELWLELNPSVQNQFPQGMSISPSGDVYVCQTEGRSGKYEEIEDLTISRFDSNGNYVAKMTGLFGHAGNLLVERDNGTDYMRFEYFKSDLKSGKVEEKRWVRIPFSGGKVWTEAQVLEYGSSIPDYPTKIKKTPWFQAYTTPYDGKSYLLYGCPYGNNGPSNGKKGYPGRIDIVSSGKVSGSIDVSRLGRGANGKPLRGRLEVEGITYARFASITYLVISVVIGGYSNGMRIQLWRMPLESTPGSKPIGGPSYDAPGVALAASYTRAARKPGPLARWLVCDTLTNRVVGELEPNAYELNDPLVGAGYGSVTLPISDDDAQVARLLRITRPRVRWIAAADTVGNIIWAGPIPRQPTDSGNTRTVPLIDWRGWFYRTYLRPKLSGGQYALDGSYYAKNVDQATIMATLIKRAMTDTLAAIPQIKVMESKATGVKREFTGLQLDRSTGDMLDDVAARERGAEWHTYAALSTDGTACQPWVKVSYPERAYRTLPFRLQWHQGVGGNCSEVVWPEPEEGSTRAWATGSGEPPKNAYALDQYPEINGATPTDVLWESISGPHDGVTKKATAYEYAYAAVQRSRRVTGQAEVTVLEEVLPFSSYEVGDRAHVILRDRTRNYDVAAARITNRVLSGGRGQATRQRLTLDLIDAHYPDDDADPGEKLATDA